jgi:hypothetical protein
MYTETDMETESNMETETESDNTQALSRMRTWTQTGMGVLLLNIYYGAIFAIVQ